MVDAASYGLRVIYSAHGGVDIERSGSAQGRLCPPHAGAVAEALGRADRRRTRGVARPYRGGRPQAGGDADRARTGAGGDQPAVRLRRRLRRGRCEAGGGPGRGRTSAAHRRNDRGAARHLRRCQPQAARRLRLRRARSGRRDRPGHHRRRPVDDADRRTRRARHEAAELLRHPHRPDARQPGAADARAGVDHVAPVAARGAGECVRRHHRSGRVRRAAGDRRWSRRRAFACRWWRGWWGVAPPRRGASWPSASPAVFVTEDLEEALRRGSRPHHSRGAGAHDRLPSGGPRANHAGHRAGHHRPHGPHARGADARLRHQHRRRHLRRAPT